jgi:hypothetical protein
MKFSSTLKMAAIAAIMLTAACAKDDTPTAMDASKVNKDYLIGKWQDNKTASHFKKYSDTISQLTGLAEGYKYGSDWGDFGDATREDQEGTKFYWKLEGNQITEYEKNMTGGIEWDGTWLEPPRLNKLIKLTATELEYFDQGNTIYRYTKQN